jgi:N-acetylglucosaminyldiphosphoundecaprenol N-acetyl-beta-D-mannosaminyltransferase
MLIARAKMQNVSNVHWLLGLGFDCVGIDEARLRIHEAVETRTKLVFATPNAHFLKEANRDAVFHKSILGTQLSLVDGMPLVWLGRLLGVPFSERVAGSTLMDRLRLGSKAASLRVFFFGGEPDVARMACQSLAGANGPMIPAGWYDPGFVSIEEMSRPDIIAAINAARPDMIIVSLGAKKGHLWIDQNRDLLEAPVLSHLGAAVGFLSGHLRRAPVLVQRCGLEWLWRTAMEPRLMTRYIGDARFLASVLFPSVVPLLIRRIMRRATSARLEILTVSEDSGSLALALCGSLLASNLRQFSACIAAVPAGKRVAVDLSQLSDMDAIAVGHLYSLKYRETVRHTHFTCKPGSAGAQLLAVYRAQCLTWRELDSDHVRVNRPSCRQKSSTRS